MQAGVGGVVGGQRANADSLIQVPLSVNEALLYRRLHRLQPRQQVRSRVGDVLHRAVRDRRGGGAADEKGERGKGEKAFHG